MEGEELRFRYNHLKRKWYAYFGCPDKKGVTCDECLDLIRQGQRVYLNFDNGKHFCETHKALALTDFVQVV